MGCKAMKDLVKYIAGGMLLAAAVSSGAAPDNAIKHCQKLKDQIERYEQLRRKGGSGTDMDDWKRARRQLEKQFRDDRCRYYRYRLK